MGTAHENPVVLTRQDWRHIQGRPWGGGSNGVWKLYVAKEGDYTVRLRLLDQKGSGTATLSIGDRHWTANLAEGDRQVLYEQVRLAQGNIDLMAMLAIGDRKVGPHQVDVYLADTSN